MTPCPPRRGIGRVGEEAARIKLSFKTMIRSSLERSSSPMSFGLHRVLHARWEAIRTIREVIARGASTFAEAALGRR